MTRIGEIAGGNGTVCVGAGEEYEGNIAMIVVREDAVDLEIYREKYTGETTFTDVTEDHYVGTTPLANDIIRGLGYNFGKVVVGTGSVTVVLG